MKRVAGVLMALGLGLSLVGCTGNFEAVSDKGETAESKASVVDGRYQKSFGSYEVPEGWVEASEYSSKNQYFYVEEGQEGEEQPDNVAVTAGKDPYKKDEGETFRDTIMNQLTEQTSEYEGIVLTSEEGMTAEGNTLYTFTIKETHPAVTTIQYYIMGDQQYCLVHETNFTGGSAVDVAARKIVDSFQWGSSND